MDAMEQLPQTKHLAKKEPYMAKLKSGEIESITPDDIKDVAKFLNADDFVRLTRMVRNGFVLMGYFSRALQTGE